MRVPKYSRRDFLATTTAIGAVGAALSFGSITTSAAGKTLNMRMSRDIDILDPGYMVGGSEIETQLSTMPTLAKYTYTGGQLGWGPTDYVTAIGHSDPTHIEFTLQEGLQWSNGFGEVTAGDVKYSFERMKGTDWSGYFDQMTEVAVKDRYSGTLVLSEPFAPIWLTSLSAGIGIILSEKATEAAGGKYTTKIPATCGPYVYDWRPKDRIVFTHNPEWNGPKPEFDEVNYILVEDGTAGELAYEAGELEVTEISSATYARYLKAAPPDSIMKIAGAQQYMWLGMNTQHPKLQDIRVRKAIQYAIDVDSIIAGAYSGAVEKSYGIVCPGLNGKRSATKYNYDPAKARALIEEAGASGLELDLKTLNAQERVLAAQICQANLQAVGINAKVIPLDPGPFWDMGQESKGDAWEDLQLWIMRYGTSPDPYECFQWFRREQVGVWNWERWSDDEFEALYKEGLVSTDPVRRNEIYLRMQEIMEDTGAYVWIDHEPEVFIHRKNIDVSIGPGGNAFFPDFKTI